MPFGVEIPDMEVGELMLPDTEEKGLMLPDMERE